MCVSWEKQLSLTELEGLRLSWESVSGGNWKSAGRVVFLLLALRADLLLVVAACEGTADNVKFSLDTQVYFETQKLVAFDRI